MLGKEEIFIRCRKMSVKIAVISEIIGKLLQTVGRRSITIG